MKTHLVTGGCGFVGRNLVKRLFKSSGNQIIIIDDLSTGKHPDHWIGIIGKKYKSAIHYSKGSSSVVFIHSDLRIILAEFLDGGDVLFQRYKIKMEKFHDVYHFAAIVGGRAIIENNPIRVAKDLAIDADFFYWVSIYKPKRVLYPSSSAAYPIKLQEKDKKIPLKESYINFDNLGMPDMTYGWSKLTGEYLAKITSLYYDVHITCIRPFSGYGEDQDTSYPIPAIVNRFALRQNPLEIWGDGTQSRDFIHIDDVIDCIFLAMDNISDGSAINIGSGKLTSFLEIINLLSEYTSFKPNIKKLIHKPVGVSNRYSDPTLSNHLLGWMPKISLKEGLIRVYNQAIK